MTKLASKKKKGGDSLQKKYKGGGSRRWQYKYMPKVESARKTENWKKEKWRGGEAGREVVGWQKML